MTTVVVPISPIPTHPDTGILAETVASVRHHLPLAEMVLTFDGVRSEQQDRCADYEEATRRTLWLADHGGWGPIAPFVFDEHLHQVGMLRRVLNEIRTPLLLFVEQDTPLEPDPIGWEACADLILTGGADVVRFAHESQILDEHKHMVVPGGPDGFVRTCQFSARPHLASVAYYRRILESHFTPAANCFIEDKMHSVCQEAFNLDGLQGWQQHKLVYFHPEGSIRRSRHTDGRAGGCKFDESQVF